MGLKDQLFFGWNDLLMFFSTAYKAMGPWDQQFFVVNDSFCFTVVLSTKLWDHGTGSI
jgi:hypothetical protein